jgi:hypothetical protein
MRIMNNNSQVSIIANLINWYRFTKCKNRVKNVTEVNRCVQAGALPVKEGGSICDRHSWLGRGGGLLTIKTGIATKGNSGSLTLSTGSAVYGIE